MPLFSYSNYVLPSHCIISESAHSFPFRCSHATLFVFLLETKALWLDSVYFEAGLEEFEVHVLAVLVCFRQFFLGSCLQQVVMQLHAIVGY